MKKKFLAVLLACMIAASAVPAVVSADGEQAVSGPVVSDDVSVGDTEVDFEDGEADGVIDTEDELRTAVAQEGSVITLGADITLKSTLNVANNVTIDGAGQFTISIADDVTWATDNSNKYMVVASSGVTVQNVTIDAENNASGCLQFYTATGGKIHNVTLTGAKQLGLNVNASTVTATGTITYTGNGWGNGINVGWGSSISGASACSFDASGATLVGVSSIYTDTNDTTNAGEGTISITPPSSFARLSDPETVGKSAICVPSETVTATVDGTSYYASFEKAVEAAQLGDTVNLQKDVTVYSAINLHNQITLNGNGHSITAGSSVEGNFVTVYEDGTNLNNVKLIAGAKSKNVLHIYQAKNIVLTDVTLDHSKALDGAPMIVNESDVTVNGNLELITGAYSWYGFNVDARNTTANVNFAEGSSVTYTGNSSNKPLAGLDQGTGTASVTDNTGKIVAASIGEGGNTDLYDSLDKAIDAAEAIEGGATVKVLQSGLSATVDTSKNIKFDVPAGVTEPVLKDQNGNSLDITEDGSVVVVPDAEAYTATINGQTYKYEAGKTVSLYAPVYSSNGAVFEKWVVVSGNAVIANVYSNQTTFVMPEGDVEIQAVYTNYQPVLPEIPEYVPEYKPETSKPETSEPETEWKRDDDGNTYFYKDGEKVTGWVEEDGEWYYMNEDTGAMTEESWVKVNNVWYAFDDDGHMLTGWQEIDGKWYYLKDWGGMATGWQQVDGKWYYLKGDGAMATGWVQSNGQWYYLKGNGAMATGWVESNGKWYYLYESGEMATNATIGGYYVNSNGEWVK